MTGSAPALVPPDPRPDPGLPRWVLPVALFGLAILLVSTLPALVARRRLERAEKALLDQSRSMDEATERVNRDRRALQADAYVFDRAVRDLFEPGPRVSMPRPPEAARRP